MRSEPALLLVDHDDSFTFNLVQALAEAGASVERVRSVSMKPVQLNLFDAVVFGPGPGRPSDWPGSEVLLKRCLESLAKSELKGLLGVCLGHQILAQACGAEVIRAPRARHGHVDLVHHGGVGLFSDLANPALLTRYHSLCVRREGLPARLELTAWSDDGVVQGVRDRTSGALGLQFHPESVASSQGPQLLRNFVEVL